MAAGGGGSAAAGRDASSVRDDGAPARSVLEGDEELLFQTTGPLEVVRSFEEMGLKEDLLKGIYAYGSCQMEAEGIVWGRA
jgi:hypothetical protein